MRLRPTKGSTLGVPLKKKAGEKREVPPWALPSPGLPVDRYSSGKRNLVTLRSALGDSPGAIVAVALAKLVGINRINRKDGVALAGARLFSATSSAHTLPSRR